MSEGGGCASSGRFEAAVGLEVHVLKRARLGMSLDPINYSGKADVPDVDRVFESAESLRSTARISQPSAKHSACTRAKALSRARAHWRSGPVRPELVLDQRVVEPRPLVVRWFARGSVVPYP